jgi:transposase
MVNGRAIVSEKRRRAKKLGHLQAALTGKQRGSRRSRKVKRHIARLKAKSARRVRDMNHKVTCGIVRGCEQANVTALVLSQPHGIAEADGRRAQRQRNGVWEYGEQSRQIAYKAQGHFEVIRDGERGTSSTCPRCHKHCPPTGRTFRCRHCGWAGHRDLVGAGNQLGRHVSHADVAALIEHTHPKYLRSFAPAKDRSSVVATDRSRVVAFQALQTWPHSLPREWPAGDHAGRATPDCQARGRKTGCSTSGVAGKTLGVPSVVAVPRTPGL